ncbi:hypothetical protein [Streptomyces griseosporeus]|uniref:hypothetical protein n=1 Tax=Streptomyces griseosporeus TaxID=1910 RepID=UPI00167CFF18|nr:hypothetical protein [Streptomyces griseosporeus]GHF79449.1 hypothetical protein GCM10018783_57250 [Streptomyces griseosporeus]
MSSGLSRHRIVLRAAVATAALAGALLTPAVAFAEGTGTTSATTSGTAAHCTVTQTIDASYGGWKVDLTNSLDAGPSAVLKDDQGKAVATVDRAHPEDLTNGMKIKDADTTTPVFLDRSQGDPAPWRETPFPALPKDCGKTEPKPEPTPTPKPTTGTDKPKPPPVLEPGTGPITVIGKCTVLQTIPSRFGGWTVDLTNSLDAGPKAVLKTDEGKVVASVDRAHPEDQEHGLWIKRADTTTPVFLDNNQGGDSPWRETPFPALPKDCVNTGAGTTKPADTATTATTTTTTTTQTKTVPVGGVAAGVEGGGTGIDTPLLAGGAATAAVGVLGLGYAVRRRRSSSRI